MNSIRLRLTRKLLLTLFLLLGGGLATVYISVRTALVHQFDESLRTKAMAIITVTEQTKAGRIKTEFSDRFMPGFDEKVATDYFEIRRMDDDTLIGRSESMGDFRLPKRLGTLSSPKYWKLELPNDLPGRAIGFRFKPKVSNESPKDMPTPELYLVVAVDRRALDNTLHVLQLVIGTCCLLLLGTTVITLPVVLKTELRPLDLLGEQAAHITAESLTTRFPVAGVPAELLPITEKLNDLLSRLEQSFERERRFSADLAHELRTPLAELRSLAEYAIKWPEAREADTDRETLAIARQMEAMVGHMLALARSERGQIQVNREPVAMDELIGTVWKAHAEKAAEKQLHVNLLLKPAKVETDSALVRSILGNLFENAVEYAPKGGEVSLELISDLQNFILRVSNTVENFERADVAKLFDRFWRKEASRTGNEHAGLGLSIARGFANALGWQLSAELEGNARLTFTLKGDLTPQNKSVQVRPTESLNNYI